MRFYTYICSKKTLNSNPSICKIKIEGIKEIEDILPTEEQFTFWVKETMSKILTGKPADQIHIKVIPELYEKIVKCLYQKIGKSIELYNKESQTYFRIPTKKGNAFFQNIDNVILISEELRCPTIVIHI